MKPILILGGLYIALQLLREQKLTNCVLDKRARGVSLLDPPDCDTFKWLGPRLTLGL